MCENHKINLKMDNICNIYIYYVLFSYRNQYIYIYI